MKQKINRLYWDIETSPNIMFGWECGYKKNIHTDMIINERAIICICYKWENEKKVHSLQWDHPTGDDPLKVGCDKEMIRKFLEVAEMADELVAHNGDQFDIKYLNTRALYHNLPVGKTLKTVDTLKIARRYFRLNSNRLDYICKYLFNEGKIHTNMSMWAAICLQGCNKAMKQMIKYCKKDVVLLQKAYHKLSQYDKDHTHVGVLNGHDAWTCPRCGSEKVRRNGSTITGTGARKQLMQCTCCGRKYRISNANLNKYKEHKYNERNNREDTPKQGSRANTT
jgi:transcription elongation factor Elf1